jgi:anti-sigma factor RsiW
VSARHGATFDWRLERYRLGELPASEEESLRRALATDADLAEKLAELERSDLEILARHPTAVVAPSIRARAAARDGVRPRPTGGRHRLALGLALASCLALAATGVVLLPGRAPNAKEDTTRVKGLAPRLFVYRKAPTGAEELAAGSAARENDVVQLAYQAAGRHFGAIVSIDGRGVVTRHLPAAGDLASPLKTGPLFALPEAYRLDDAPGFERFYFVTADQPFAVDLVLNALSHPAGAEGRLALPTGLDEYSFALRKETSR